ncbi:MAG: hypothetical protein B9S37_06455 [Verrucomicrobiia bacterium Tous-C3TDCM]|nr:MAG: hypothetical protein B9S37_06455 [Verrucomicrobiae bacterium Tous-C3TDCM]PAZ06315.1 MAG: hypothetical protein CAK88_05295 [Verrucomicrobiae bacterium AMD-G2]
MLVTAAVDSIAEIDEARHNIARKKFMIILLKKELSRWSILLICCQFTSQASHPNKIINKKLGFFAYLDAKRSDPNFDSD